MRVEGTDNDVVLAVKSNMKHVTYLSKNISGEVSQGLSPRPMVEILTQKPKTIRRFVDSGKDGLWLRTTSETRIYEITCTDRSNLIPKNFKSG